MFVVSTKPWKQVCGLYTGMLILAAVIGAFIIWCPLIPAGIPEQWEWQRHLVPVDALDWLERFLPASVVGVFYFGLARIGHQWFSRLTARRGQPASGSVEVNRRTWRHILVGTAFVLAVTGLTGFWQIAVQQAAPSPHRNVKPYWIVYDKYASGYFYEAAFKIDSAAEMLKGYDDRMREGDVLHVGTHPPGLFLMSLMALQWTEQSPALVSFLEAIRNSETERTFRELESQAGFSVPLSQNQLAALQLVFWFSAVFAALAVIPIFLLGKQLADATTGWMAACLYGTMPAISVFSPKSDVLYTLTGMLFLWLACAAVYQSRAVTRMAIAVAAGMMLFVGMVLSLAHLPVIVVAFVFVALVIWHRGHGRLASLATGLVLLLISWLCCVVLFALATDCNLLIVWKQNLTNHEGFYDTSTRTWWKWALVNPVELALSVGFPLCAVACVAVWTSFRGALIHFAQRQPIAPIAAMVAASAITWVALWLSGKNMGEAARLWCFLMPWLALAAAAGLNCITDAGQQVEPGNSLSQAIQRHEQQSTLFRLLFILQLLTCVSTVARINGFSI